MGNPYRDALVNLAADLHKAGEPAVSLNVQARIDAADEAAKRFAQNPLSVRLAARLVYFGLPAVTVNGIIEAVAEEQVTGGSWQQGKEDALRAIRAWAKRIREDPEPILSKTVLEQFAEGAQNAAAVVERDLHTESFGEFEKAQGWAKALLEALGGVIHDLRGAMCNLEPTSAGGRPLTAEEAVKLYERLKRVDARGAPAYSGAHKAKVFRWPRLPEGTIE